MKKSFSFIKELLNNRYQIWQLIYRNLTSQYKRSYLGVFWSLLEPILFMVVLYIVFGIGLRTGREMSIPFICYLVTGLAVNNFFTTTLNKGTQSVISHSYLLKKVDFNMSILPIVVVITGLIEHLIFLIPVIIILISNKILPSLYWIQLLYYLFSLSLFLIGITYSTSAFGVFFPDITNIVNVIGRVLFYFSPIFWEIEMLPASLQKYAKLNPLYYIMMGYRESFFYKTTFWEQWRLGLYFWSWTILSLFFGIYFFKKLRPQFSDVI